MDLRLRQFMICMNQIKKQTSNEEFARWFAPITPIAFDGTKLRLRVPNVNYAKHIEQNYLEILRPVIFQMFGHQTRLVYAVPNSEEKTPISANADMTAISQHVTQTNTQNLPKNPFAIPGIKKVMLYN